MLAPTVGKWFSEGLLAIFFLLVGLEIRREMTAGALTDRKAAVLPAVAALGGVLGPTAICLALNPGPTAPGWSVPTATDIAFTLGILALLGDRIPIGLRVFVAALAVVDDVLSVLTLAIFYPRAFELGWLFGSAIAAALLYALNRWRVYAIWPYVVVAAALGLMLHGAGVHAALGSSLPPSCRHDPLRPWAHCSAKRQLRSRLLSMRRTRQRKRARNFGSNMSQSGIGRAETSPRQATGCYRPQIVLSALSRPGQPM
jgi:hypothetical protein